MTLGCSFNVMGITLDGQQEVISVVPNIVTLDGLKYIAGTKKFKPAGETADFHPSVNAIFLGSDSTPTKFTDNGLKDLQVILPSANMNSYTYGQEEFYTPEVMLPAGTYTELAAGYYDPQTQQSFYYNRAVLETPLVIDAAFYGRYRAITFVYKFDFFPSPSYGRSSELTINEKVYTVNTQALIRHFYGEWGDYLYAFDTDKGSVKAGIMGTRALDGTVTYSAEPTTHVRMMEITITNTGTGPTDIEDIWFRNGAFMYIIQVRDADKKGIPMTAGQTLKLQLECFYLPNYGTEFTLTQNDKGPGYNPDRYIMRSKSIEFNRYSLKSVYAINVETGERIDYDRASLGISDDTGATYPKDDLARSANPIYNDIDIDSEYLDLDKTGVWKIFMVNHKDAIWQHTIVGDKTIKPVTFQVPDITLNLGVGRITINGKPSQATHLRMYDTYRDRYEDCLIKVDGTINYIDVPTDMLGHVRSGIAITAIRYFNSNVPTQNGIWATVYTRDNEYRGLLNPMSTNNALTHAGMKTMPIIGMRYDRAAMTLKGHAFNGNKVRIKEVDGPGLYEFDVTPNSEFNIDLSATEMSLAKNYKFTLIGDLGESDGPIYVGFKSVDVAKVTDAVYSAANATITFTRPADYITHVVLRRWGFQFYRLELTTGQNVLRLSSTLDENGQWELIALDENGTESEPFYIFGEKPEDIPVKPENTLPVLNPVVTSASDLKTSTMGYYPNVKTAKIKWWEEVTWHAQIDGIDADVEFMGVVSLYDNSVTNYVPMLGFKLIQGEKSLLFGLLDVPRNNNTTGYWQALGGLTTTNVTVTLWHDWRPYDGYTESDVYSSYNSTGTRVYGTGNGFHQVTEIESGFVRRALGLKLDFSRNAAGIGGACPIDFDQSYLDQGNVSVVPETRMMLPYMQVVLGRVLNQAGPGYITGRAIEYYTVRINGKLATVSEKVPKPGDNSNDLYTSVTWANEDGVAYRLDLNTWFWIRTDRDAHKDDPAYQDVIDTIQLCFSETYRDQWGGGPYAFQSGTTNGSTSFNANIRVISYQYYWQSVKAWVRPYHSVNEDMTLTTEDTQYESQTSIQIGMDFDTSLIDASNALEITINGEVATLVEPTVPQLVEGMMLRNQETWEEYKPVSLGDNFTRLYDQLPLNPKRTSSFINYVSNQYTHNSATWSVSRHFDIAFITPNKAAYEAYRLSLSNADDYLTYDELMPIVRAGSYDVAFVAELLPEEKRTKKICVPYLWGRTCLEAAINALENYPDEKVIGYDSVTEFTIAEYANTLLNCGLLDSSKLMNFGSAHVIVGHRELTINSNSLPIKSCTQFKVNDNTIHEVQSRSVRSILLLDMLTNLNYDDNLYYYYSLQFDRTDFSNMSRFIYVVPYDTATAKSLSLAIFGEERTYNAADSTGVVNSQYATNVDQIIKNGVFSVKRARELGYTGKFIYAITMSAIMPAYERSRQKDYPERSAVFLNVAPEDTASYLESLYVEKPYWGNEVIIDYVEVDLDASDEDLEAIPSRLHYLLPADSSATPMQEYARIYVSVDDTAPMPMLPADAHLIDDATGKEVTYRHNPLDMYEVTDPIYLCRRIVSENYELVEMTGKRGRWKMVRAKDDRVITDNYSRLYYPSLKIIVKTKKFNTFNIFVKSPTAPLTKTTGDTVGHYLCILMRSYDVSMLTSNTKYFTDPRQLKIRDSYRIYQDEHGLGYALYRLINVLYSHTDGYVTAFYPMSWNNELVHFEPAAGWDYRVTGFTSPYTRMYAGRIVRQDGTEIAKMFVAPYAASGYSVQMELADKTPGFYQLNLLMANLDYNSVYNIRRLYMIEEMTENDFYYAGGFNVADFSAPPPLDNYNFADAYSDRWSAGNQEDFNNVSTYKPFPAWSMVGSVEDFQANFNVYINRELASIASFSLTDSFDGRFISCVMYELSTSAAVFRLYYAPPVGAYRSEYISQNTTEKTAELIIEHTKTQVSVTNNPYYTPIFTYADFYDNYALTDMYENNGSTTNNYLQNNRIYSVNSDVFFKPSAYFLLNNPDYIDESKLIAESWRAGFATSYGNAVRQFNEIGFMEIVMGGEIAQLEDIAPKTVLPVPIGVNGTYPEQIGTFAINGELYTYPMVETLEDGYNYQADAPYETSLRIGARYNPMYGDFQPAPMSLDGEEPNGDYPLPTPMVDIRYLNDNVHPLDTFFAFSYIPLSAAELNGGGMEVSLPEASLMSASFMSEVSEVSEVDSPDGPVLTEADGTYLPVAGAEFDMDGMYGPYQKVNSLAEGYVDFPASPGMRHYVNTVTNHYTGQVSDVVHVVVANPLFDMALMMELAPIIQSEASYKYGQDAPVRWAPKLNVDDYNHRGLFRMFTQGGVAIEGNTSVWRDGPNVEMYNNFIILPETPNSSSQFIRRSYYWNTETGMSETNPSWEERGHLVDQQEYFFLSYISPWTTDPEYDVDFKDSKTGDVLTAEAVQQLYTADPEYPIFVKRETRTVDEVEEFRIVVVERILNPFYVPVVDINAQTPYQVVRAKIDQLTGGMDLLDMESPMVPAELPTIQDIGIPNPILFLFVLGNEDLGYNREAFLPWLKTTCTVEMFNDLFSVSVNRNAATFTSWTYDEVENTFTLEMTSPDLNVTYKYTDVLQVPENATYERITYNATATVTMVNLELTKLPIEYIPKQWVRGMIDDANEFWYPDFAFVLSSKKEDGYMRPLYANNLATASFVVEEERSGIWIEYCLGYYTTEPKSFGPYEDSLWPQPGNIKTTAGDRPGWIPPDEGGGPEMPS